MGDTQAADQHTDSTDTPPATTEGSNEADTTETAVEIARKFGTTDTDTHENVQECVVGSDDIVLWAPVEVEDPAGIPISGFDADAGYTSQYANIDGTVRTVYGMTAADTVHWLQADPLHNLADVLDMTPAGLMDVARINTDKGNWPVLFDLTVTERHDGHVLVADTKSEGSGDGSTENPEAGQ